MSYSDRASPSRRTDPRDEEGLNHQLRRKQHEQTRTNLDPRRNGGWGGFRRRRRDRDGARNRTDQRLIHHENRGRVEQQDSVGSIGLGDHCRDNSGSRDHRKREESWTKKTTALDQRQATVGGGEIKKESESIDVRNDLRKEIGKIKKALNLNGGDQTGEFDNFGGGLNNKRHAVDDLEGSKPKKKKKKKKNKSAAAMAEKRENVEGKNQAIPKPKDLLALEKDNFLLRGKLQEILDENMKLKVDFQSLNRKWDDADVRIVKLEELARDKDAKIVELERDSVRIMDKLESKNRFISDLEKENKTVLEKLDSKRKLIRDLDDEILSKDEKYEMIKNEIEEKERHLTKLIQLKDEIYKSKEVVLKENEEIKKLAKGISNDSDVLVKKLHEKETLVTSLKLQLSEAKENQKFGEQRSSIELDNAALKDALDAKENIVKDLQEERDKAAQLHAQLESTIKDLKYKIRKDISKKEVPETTLSEKCDSSVAHGDDGENYDLEEETSLAIGNELPDSLFEPLSDELCHSDDDEDALKVTSTENSIERKDVTIEENLAKKSVPIKKSCPFKLNQIPKYSMDEPKQGGYKMVKRKLLAVEVPCLTVDSGSSSKSITLDDFARSFYPKLSVKRVGIILEELGIPFYNGNTEQEHVLRQDRVRYVFNPIPLIMFEDVEKQEDDLKSLFSNF